MAINSLKFIVFVAVVCCIYFIAPKKIKWVVLLLANYIFYWLCSNWLIVYMLITTLSIYLIGLRIGVIDKHTKEKCKGLQDREQKKTIKNKAKTRKKWEVFFAVLINFGILIALKYCNFVSGNLNSLFEKFNLNISIPFKQIILPLGISYYTLQAISYVVDVYRAQYLPEKNIGKIALFVSFFPQMVEGPIGRYDALANQLYEPHKFEYERVKFGAQLMLWGYLKKIVIADRAGLFVNEVFANYGNYSGIPIFIAATLYTIQIYAEFSGCIDIVRGTAQILGIEMAENFKRPFFSKSVQEFWRRWHITLGTWFKDYVFYPISFSKANRNVANFSKKIFKESHIATIIPAIFSLFFVWMGTGIWHGASWKYVVYGLYYYLVMVIGMIFEPLFNKLKEKLKIDVESFSYKLWQMLRTTIIVIFGMLLFRAKDLQEYGAMFKSIFKTKNLSLLSNGKIFEIGFKPIAFNIILIGVLVMFVVGLLQERGHNIRKDISKQNLIFRWIIYYLAFFAIVILGVYGPGYAASDFIYGQF